ncbi:hypothetical protein BD779DRAFT_1473515 [Infundibulicybe gibba]|nr:hypothetical protein BD779DRAFT_1473515 [Infundibulicybe gibba]
MATVKQNEPSPERPLTPVEAPHLSKRECCYVETLCGRRGGKAATSRSNQPVAPTIPRHPPAPYRISAAQGDKASGMRTSEQRPKNENGRLEREWLESERRAQSKAMYAIYEQQWSRLATMNELRWDSFPWPTPTMPSTPVEITAAAIRGYILSPDFPESIPPRPLTVRVDEYIQRWHPNRLGRGLLLRLSKPQGDGVGGCVGGDHWPQGYPKGGDTKEAGGAIGVGGDSWGVVGMMIGLVRFIIGPVAVRGGGWGDSRAFSVLRSRSVSARSAVSNAKKAAEWKVTKLGGPALNICNITASTEKSWAQRQTESTNKQGELPPGARATGSPQARPRRVGRRPGFRHGRAPVGGQALGRVVAAVKAADVYVIHDLSPFNSAVDACCKRNGNTRSAIWTYDIYPGHSILIQSGSIAISTFWVPVILRKVFIESIAKPGLQIHSTRRLVPTNGRIRIWHRFSHLNPCKPSEETSALWREAQGKTPGPPQRAPDTAEHDDGFGDWPVAPTVWQPIMPPFGALRPTQSTHAANGTEFPLLFAGTSKHTTYPKGFYTSNNR